MKTFTPTGATRLPVQLGIGVVPLGDVLCLETGRLSFVTQCYFYNHQELSASGSSDMVLAFGRQEFYDVSSALSLRIQGRKDFVISNMELDFELPLRTTTAVIHLLLTIEEDKPST